MILESLAFSYEKKKTEGEEITGRPTLVVHVAGAVSGVARWREIVGESFRLETFEPGETSYFEEHEAAFRPMAREKLLEER